MVRQFMHSRLLLGFLFVGYSVAISSCATGFGGRRTAYQITKPRDGEPQREVRVGALIADIILFPPGLIVDFATGAIYKPAPIRPPLAPPASPAYIH